MPEIDCAASSRSPLDEIPGEINQVPAGAPIVEVDARKSAFIENMGIQVLTRAVGRAPFAA
jgi:hypothetical protein